MIICSVERNIQYGVVIRKSMMYNVADAVANSGGFKSVKKKLCFVKKVSVL